MRQRSIRVVLALLLLCSFSFALGTSKRSYHSSTSYSSRPRKSKSSAGKTEHVSGYTRKDGRYVHGYDRHSAGTAPHSSTSSPETYRRNYVADGFAANSTVQRDKHGRIKRSSAAKNTFKRDHPCPATGKSSGRCPGYVVDHVRPLECGGADAPSNMQWQTSAEGKAKDKTEGSCRL
jgi:hypothetical protein